MTSPEIETPPDTDLVGFLDAAHDDGWIDGWARDPATPERAIEVDVVIDGQTVERTLADQFREDLTKEGWGNCAFRFRIPDAYRDHQEHRVEVRFAATALPLSGSPQVFVSRESTLDGVFDALEDGLWASGWARDSARPGEPAEIEIFVDTDSIGSFAANRERADLTAVGWGDCAFKVRLPDRYADGAEHRLEVRFAQGGPALQNVPHVFATWEAGLPARGPKDAGQDDATQDDVAPGLPADDRSPSLQGVFDNVEDEGWVAGWAARSDGHPAVLEVVIDQEVAGTLTADQYRQDLREVGIGDCAFWYRLPRRFKDGKQHEVSLREAGTGAVLAGSPKTFSFEATGAKAGARNLFPNGHLASWPKGLIVWPRQPFEEVAEGWFFDRSTNTDPDVVCMADKPVDIALAPDAYAMKVTVTEADEGYMRLVVPLSMPFETLRRYRFSMGMRRKPYSEISSLHVREIFLGALKGTAVQKVSTVRKALKQTGTIRLNQLPLDRSAGAQDIAPGSTPCLVFDLHGEGELTLFSPALMPVGVRDLPQETAAAGEFEDPNIRVQSKRLKLSPLWTEARAVPGPLGAAPRPAAEPRAPHACAAVPFIQIVVPVFNAVSDVETLLASILRGTGTPFEVLLCDDGSGAYTASRVTAWQRLDPRIRVLRHEDNLGYTRNINVGLQSAVSDHVVLINSDTIVTPRWLEKMFQVMALDERIAAVGPLSNAASWQSVPRTKGTDGDWLVNSFDADQSPDWIAALLEEIHDGTAPDFPLLNGFCTLFRKRALEEVGYFDDAAFPRGYGEENDLCLRLGQAGWELRVATDTYVHHAKSKSFGNANRKELSRAAGKVLREKHPEVSFPAVEERMRTDPGLIRIRRELSERVAIERDFSRP